MSRASFSICGSVASAAAISRGISTRPCTSLASSESDNSQRGEGIGGLAGLRDEDRQIALAQRRLAITEFRGDIDFDGQAAQAFEPVFGDATRISIVACGTARCAGCP